MVLLVVCSFQVISVQAQNIETSKVLQEEETSEVVEKKMNLFEELHYRLFLKDTRDFFDYLLLAIFVVGLLIVLVFKNTHYVVVQKPLEAKTFLESGSDYSIEEIGEATIIEEEPEEKEEIIEENPEILSSELLEEETVEVPRKKHKKKRRA